MNAMTTLNPSPPDSFCRPRITPGSGRGWLVRSPAFLCLLAFLPPFLGSLPAAIVLPGTQPLEGGIEFGKVAQCVLCHAETKNGLADPYASWHGSMMGQAARDPVFRAALAVANQDLAGVGEFCLRCHAPRGWFAGRSSAADGSSLNREDLHGVSCEVCHHLVDPLSAEARRLAKQIPPGYGNAMMVADPENVVRGPYEETKGAMPHHMLKSAHQASSEFCGTCHITSNPFQARDVNTQPPYAYGHIERTYSEWASSDFAKPGFLQTCQTCHFARVAGGGQASKYGDLHRDYFVSHAATGASTWVQDAILQTWTNAAGRDLEPDALQAVQRQARGFLKTAAALRLDLLEGKARLTITNLTGHKLPTGYPEGRRMWIQMRFLDQTGRALGEVGRYGDKDDTLGGQPVKVSTLLDPEKTRVYECLPGLSAAAAERFHKRPGASFHFILNDMIVKDNRIPPRGYTRAAFATHLGAPVGADYADGQYWDTAEFALPAGTQRVEARLLFQSVSWEYLKFLLEENHSDPWGRRLYEAWDKTGRCPPETIATITKPGN
jgi:hypothetical protein